MIRFRQIEAFRALITTGSSVGAARAMQVTQPAISRLIADLETETGLTLFNRTGGRLTPTILATQFFKSVQESFVGLEGLQRAADRLRHGVREEFSIASSPNLAASLLPTILCAFKKRRPNTLVNVVTRDTNAALDDLRNHKVQVALCPAIPNAANLDSEPLTRGEIHCVMPVGHPLANRDRLTLDELVGERIIGPLPDIGQDLFSPDDESHPFHRLQCSITATDAHARHAFVEANLGIALFDSTESQIWERYDVAVRPFAEPIECRYVAAFPNGGMQSSLLRDFLDSTRAAARASWPDLALELTE
ncbi:hypothetical protein WK56_19400 [Burkholderia ubonensis]|uniref:LysR family transcriptional regulator n=1 Tax=Burkholderia ubonensis TaxID=101571 RepID=UPI00075A1B17|nr:LysR family transcriptional regulator [Burkholderia ubonensis]KVT70099.1 hypothetical protein WK56_19400 [Burkholderia ubonensis]